MMVDRDAYQFMRKHAGWIVGKNAKGALDLARAEQLLGEARDLEVVYVHWEWDDEPYEHGILTNEEVQAKFDSNEWTGPFGCIIESSQHNLYASVWGIVVGQAGTNDPYCRVVEAELALNIADDLRQAIGDTRDELTLTTLERTP